jgi:hypothetical protein
MKLTIDWSKVPSEFKWAAMDADGGVWAFSCKPVKMSDCFDLSPNLGIAHYVDTAPCSDDWRDLLTERPEEPTVKQPAQSTATKHPHADFIAEALKDVLRQIQVKIAACTDVDFRNVTLQEAIDYNENFVFRFADTVKPEVTSPLTDDDLVKAGQMTSVGLGYIDAMRRVAIAAKIATLKEVAAMPSETNLDCSGGGFSAAMMQEFGNACIAEFQAKLLKQLGE